MVSRALQVDLAQTRTTNAERSWIGLDWPTRDRSIKLPIYESTRKESGMRDFLVPRRLDSLTLDIHGFELRQHPSSMAYEEPSGA